MCRQQEPDRLTCDASAALKAGMSYGQWMARKPPRVLASIAATVRPVSTTDPANIVYCHVCGAAIDITLTKRRKYCSDACCKVQHNRCMRRYRDAKPSE